jgi:nucleotide-binding universal stress UspA family protein
MPSLLHPVRSPLRTIVVATDFSSNASLALDWAVSIGAAHAARLVLVNAAHPSAIPARPGAGQRDANGNGTQRRMQDLVKRVEHAHLAVTVECHPGRPWEIINAAAERHEADVIVIGSRGLTPFDRLLLGSTADRVIRTARAPVMVVHPDDSVRSPGIRTVLVATDFSEESALAASAAVRLLAAAAPGEARLILLHACAPPFVYAGTDAPVVLVADWDEMEQEARRTLETLAAPLRASGLTVETRTCRAYPLEAIDREARAARADVIALGTRGRSGLNHLLIGSVAERVVHHAACPVLTVRRPAPTEPIRLAEE